MKHYPCILTIAGSDCCGGAGIQADIKTISALGAYATSVITAVTAQNTCKVTGIHSIPSAFIKEQIEDVMNRMAIAHRTKHFPQQLSGGQQQRVAIARAVVTNPQLILADEPTGNLDSKNGREVMELLTELNKEGTTIVMVTHSQHDAGYANRIINLFDGEVVTEVTI